MALPSLQSFADSLSARERRMLTILVSVLGLLFVAGLFYFSWSALDEINTERASLLDALRTIRRERPKIRERQAQKDAMLARYRQKAPALASFVEEAARQANVTLQGVLDRPSPAVNNAKFQRRSVSLDIRKVDLGALLEFMATIEQADFPVAITAFRLRRSQAEANTYAVDGLVVSTWDRVETASQRRGQGSGSGGATGGSASSGGSTPSGTAGGQTDRAPGSTP